MRTETEFAAGGGSRADGPQLIGERSRFTCPECHGAPGEVREGSILAFSLPHRACIHAVSRAMDCGDKGRYIRALLEDPKSLGHDEGTTAPTPGKINAE